MSARLVVALNGSPLRDGNVDRMLAAVLAGAVEAGGFAEHVRCVDLKVMPCMACGPEPSEALCIFRDHMDRVYALLEASHAIVVGSPIHFDTVSAPLKTVMDRCNCVTPLVSLEGGAHAFRPRWERTRRGVFVTACDEGGRTEFAERTVRGFLKWVGAKWEETLVYAHADIECGSVKDHPDVLARAHALGRRLVESPALEPERSA